MFRGLDYYKAPALIDPNLEEPIDELALPEKENIGKFNRLKRRLARNSVTQDTFLSSLMDQNAPKNFDNLQAYAGSTIREMLFGPVRNAGNAMDNALQGKPMTIKDMLAVTERYLYRDG